MGWRFWSLLICALAFLRTFRTTKMTQVISAGEVYFKDFSIDDIETTNAVSYVKSQLHLKEKVEEIIRPFGGNVVGAIPITGDYQIEFSERKTYDELAEIKEGLSEYEFIEQASLHKAFFISDFSTQTKITMDDSDWNMMAIHAQEVWNNGILNYRCRTW
jgi:hypothetical protein